MCILFFLFLFCFGKSETKTERIKRNGKINVVASAEMMKEWAFTLFLSACFDSLFLIFQPVVFVVKTAT